MRGVEHETWRKYRRFFEGMGVSGWDGISKVHTKVGKWNRERIRTKQQISSGRHARKAWRCIRQRGTIREAPAQSHAKTKLPKRRSLRPASFSRYGRVTLWTSTWIGLVSGMRKRFSIPEQRKLKGPKVEIYNPYW